MLGTDAVEKWLIRFDYILVIFACQVILVLPKQVVSAKGKTIKIKQVQ